MSRLIVAKSNRGIPDPVGLDNIAGNQINPATEDTLATLKALLDSTVSTNNSSTSILGIGGIFTGVFEDVLKYAHITVQVRTDQISASDGLEIQWSSDGTNIDDTNVFTIPANNGKIFTFGPQARFFRVKYTNGVNAQTVFRLQTILKSFNQKSSIHRITDNIATDDDAELVKAVLVGKDDAGLFLNLRTNSNGTLLVSAPPPVAPPGTTPVIRTEFGSVSGQDDNVFIIPNGETLRITRFSAGAESDTTAGNVIELLDDPNGNGSVLTPIDVIFASGVSDQHDLSEDFVGDGTRAIRMRRRRLSGGSKEMFGRWEGFF